jgi:glycosyltransferase involved in cell wall biosynthesis
MKVIHVTNSNARNILGFEKHALNLAIAQKASGCDVTIVLDRPGVLSAACREHAIPVVVEKELKTSSTEETTQAFMGQFSSLSPDVIHCHTPGAAAQAIPAGNRLRIPCVLTLHVSGNANGAFGVMNPVLMMRRTGMRFTAIAVSKANFESMKRQGIPEEELYYVPNGTMRAPLARVPETGGLKQPNLIFVGSLTPRKGVDLAILAMAELRRRLGYDCPALNIYGSGNLQAEEHYKEMVTVLELKDIVRFCGFQLNVLDRCPDSDILIMPSHSELGPLVVLEAMSRGMPIVASEVGEVRDMLPDRRYGRIVPTNSIIPLADAVESLLTDIARGLFEPDLIIERHRAFYTREKMAERVDAVYKAARRRTNVGDVADQASLWAVPDRSSRPAAGRYPRTRRAG